MKSLEAIGNIYNKNYHICHFGNDIDMLYCNTIKYIENITNHEIVSKRRIEITINSKTYTFKISEHHVEIDFELLGVQAFHIFGELFNQIKDASRERKIFVCLNIDVCRCDLLNIFHTFLKFNRLKFILLTRKPSYLPNNINKRCLFVSNKKNCDEPLYNRVHEPICNDIIEIMLDKDTVFNIKLPKLRLNIYNLFIHNFNIHDSFYYIIKEYITLNNELTEKDIMKILDSSIDIINMYNQNHRSLFHYENFLLNIMKLNITN